MILKPSKCLSRAKLYHNQLKNDFSSVKSRNLDRVWAKEDFKKQKWTYSGWRWWNDGIWRLPRVC